MAKPNRAFQSNAEFFAALDGLVADLERTGNVTAAERLKAGKRCLNGLTDGWGLLLESLDSVLDTDASTVNRAQRQLLEDMREAVEGVIRRR
jgi:hypothetical protein